MPNEPVAKPVVTLDVPVRFWPGMRRLYYDESHRNHVIFAGIGWGKTFAGMRWAYRRILRNQASKSSKRGAIIAPTRKHLEEIHLPEFKAYLRELGYVEEVHYRVNLQKLTLKFFPSSGIEYSVMFISMHKWDSMVAWQFDWVWWDEPGFGSLNLKEFIDQRVGRVKGTALAQVLYTGVVQISNWYYDLFGVGAPFEVTAKYRLPDWVENYAPGYGGVELTRFRENNSTLVLHGSTFENWELEPEYFHRQFESYGYKTSKFRAQVLGEAIAVNSNAVYDEFDYPASIGDFKPDFAGKTNILNACFDFNFGKMAVLCAQAYWGAHFVTWENDKVLHTTEAAAKYFVERFPREKYGDREVRVNGDSAGWARNHQVRSTDGGYEIIRNILQPHYRRVIIEAPYETIPQDVRVSSTNKFHALAKKNAAVKPNGRGLYADEMCRKLYTGWQVVSWDPVRGKIMKSAEDKETHWAEAVDNYMYVAEPPSNAPNVWTSRAA